MNVTIEVTAKFHGILASWLGTPGDNFTLPENASLAELILAIRSRFEDNMPPQLWDSQNNTFTSQVQAKSGDKPIDHPLAPLSDGDEIWFFLMLAGG